MSILNLLLEKQKWQEFLDYKISKSHLTKLEEQILIEFITQEKYAEASKQIVDGTYTFSIPTKSLVNKSGSTKKRVVYTFNPTENIILKYIAFQLGKYDGCFANNLHSFRKNSTVKKAFYSIANTPNIDDMYAYKLDISNYFNSINVKKLLPILKKVVNDDEPLFNLIKSLLLVDKSIFNDKVIKEKRGVMAGTSLSTFLANVYLMDLDKYFEEKGVVYARYSDDIMIFAKSKTTLNKYKKFIFDFVKDKDLVINKDKENLFLPNTAWNFLGFEYDKGTIDLSQVTLKKIKDKIRRKARALYRWKTANDKTDEHAMRVMIHIFNKKFYQIEHFKDLTWSKWFFPVITTHNTLKVIDDYLLQYVRYIGSGKFCKKNYNTTYDTLKEYGFRSLVNEYHK
jgi:hypothetical protein